MNKIFILTENIDVDITNFAQRNLYLFMFKKILANFSFLLLLLYPLMPLKSYEVTPVFANAKYNYEYRYILIAENGGLSVYKTTDLQNPVRVIEFDINYLPKQDQEELKKGIMIIDANELRDRIEDYTG